MKGTVLVYVGDGPILCPACAFAAGLLTRPVRVNVRLGVRKMRVQCGHWTPVTKEAE